MSRGLRTGLPVRMAVLVSWTASALGTGVAAQATAKADPAAAERWLASDQTSRSQLDDAVKGLLLQPDAGFEWLAGGLASTGSPTEPRRKGIEALITHCTLEFVRRQRTSGVSYVGQYDSLRRVQPYVGDLLFGLLTETPDWYPHTHRIHLVRPLRDLQVGSPGEPRLGQVIGIVENVAIEPEDLRTALACMLWQWGQRRFAQERLDALLQASAEGDAEDRVRRMLDLAELQYDLRDYRGSAGTHRSLQVLASSSGVPLKPIDLYSSACAHALIGDVERGISSLQKCAVLQSGASVDSSLKLARTLFETDPEIAILRRDPRFPSILGQAFGSEPAPTQTPRR